MGKAPQIDLIYYLWYYNKEKHLLLNIKADRSKDENVFQYEATVRNLDNLMIIITRFFPNRRRVFKQVVKSMEKLTNSKFRELENGFLDFPFRFLASTKGLEILLDFETEDGVLIYPTQIRKGVRFSKLAKDVFTLFHPSGLNSFYDNILIKPFPDYN